MSYLADKMAFGYKPVGRTESARSETIKKSRFSSDDSTWVNYLARESVQNFNDARRKKPDGTKFPARIDVRMVDAESGLDTDSLKQIFDPEFERHINAVEGVTRVEEYGSSTALILSDRGTTGLAGPIGREYGADPNNWVAFFHDSGLQQKRKNKDLGSEGLGAMTYFLYSKYNSLFVISRHDGDSERMMGKVWNIKPHYLDGQLYHNYFFYKPKSAEDDEPTTDANVIAELRNTFNVPPRAPGDYGADWIIPFPNEEITTEGYLRACLEEFSFLIFQGGLEFEIAGTALNANTLLDVAENYQLSSSKEFLELSQYAATGDIEHFALPPAWLSGRELAESVTNQEGWSDIQREFDAGEIVSFKCPVSIEKVDRETGDTTILPSFFYLHLQRKAGREDPTEESVLRGGLSISRERGLSKRFSKGLMSILDVPEDTDLFDFAKGCEDVAHDRWVIKWGEESGDYKNVSKSLNCLKHGPRAIVAALRDQGDTLDRGFFADIL
ncbi:hypothetical protein OBB00_09110, partial [Gammaproteobacteria bacterium]|nr:hypothetical protein [Gammaproteobacteria bacterium]